MTDRDDCGEHHYHPQGVLPGPDDVYECIDCGKKVVR